MNLKLRIGDCIDLLLKVSSGRWIFSTTHFPHVSFLSSDGKELPHKGKWMGRLFYSILEFLIRWDNVTSSGPPLLWPPRPDSADSERLQLLS